jgi:hypothetical protein
MLTLTAPNQKARAFSYPITIITKAALFFAGIQLIKRMKGKEMLPG